MWPYKVWAKWPPDCPEVSGHGTILDEENKFIKAKTLEGGNLTTVNNPNLILLLSALAARLMHPFKGSVKFLHLAEELEGIVS